MSREIPSGGEKSAWDGEDEITHAKLEPVSELPPKIRNRILSGKGSLGKGIRGMTSDQRASAAFREKEAIEDKLIENIDADRRQSQIPEGLKADDEKQATAETDYSDYEPAQVSGSEEAAAAVSPRAAEGEEETPATVAGLHTSSREPSWVMTEPKSPFERKAGPHGARLPRRKEHRKYKAPSPEQGTESAPPA